MVPAGTVLRRLPDVGVAFTGGDGTLRQRRDTIHLVSVKLPYAMKVYSGAIVLHAIRDMDFNGIAPVGFDCWTGELAINQEHGSFDAIWGSGCVDNVKMVLSHDTSIRGGIVIISVYIVLIELGLVDWLFGTSTP